ncbi:MAG: tRNA (N6-threonylcarbamoyladenosine(37)-N6)-methyltransferase TrmO [Methanotrichaceae archaeon]|nr:tRNA (N6-threonylcarbamoyladenosine(37)-N6)-methyltransferase TrmO [Methanotrichaceae archaeon]
MDDQEIIFKPIGVVENDFQDSDDPDTIRNSQSFLVLDEKYVPALEGIEHYSYLLVVYHIDRSPGYHERVHPMGDPSIPERGVFSTRSPCRPNPIGITIVEILGIEASIIKVAGLDALNGSPILDIKPYEEHFDSPVGLQRGKERSYQPSDTDH